MVVKGEWAEPCLECGAIDGCCESSKMRRDIGTDLSLLVGRQSAQITELNRKLAEAHQVIGDMRAAAVKPLDAADEARERHEISMGLKRARKENV